MNDKNRENEKDTIDLKEKKTDICVHNNIEKKHWHGIIQIISWCGFCIICGISVELVLVNQFQIYNILLADLTFLAITIAITCSHAYNCSPNPNASYLWNLAEKKRSVWLHANHCWQTVHIWMTITPLYCTCIAIYLSGYNMNQEHILIYSILSLVISLGVYAINPAKRALAYRNAYTLVVDALSDYELNPQDGEKKLAKAIKKGTKAIVKLEGEE